MQKIKLLKKDIFRMAEGSDPLLHFTVLALAIFGIVMVGSASMGEAVGNQKVLIMAIVKQAVFVTAGYMAMAAASRKFRIKHLSSDVFSVLILIEMALLAVCFIFPATNGANAWIHINLGFTRITLQPSEFAKILMYLTIATHFANRNPNTWKMKQSVYKTLLVLVPFLILIAVVESDFGTAVILFLMSCVCILVPRNRKMTKLQSVLKILFVIAVFAVALFFGSSNTEAFIQALPLKEYQKNRISTAINPFQDKYGAGYQLIQSLIAMSSGGIRGVGFGKSVRKYMNFPEATSDYILGIVVEELGFVGFLILMIIYMVIIFRLLVYAKRIRNEAARIILVGTAMYFLIHVFLNVGGVSGMIPLTGIPLPLMSAGGSSAVSFMLSIGLSQSVIAAYNRKEIV